MPRYWSLITSAEWWAYCAAGLSFTNIRLRMLSWLGSDIIWCSPFCDRKLYKYGTAASTLLEKFCQLMLSKLKPPQTIYKYVEVVDVQLCHKSTAMMCTGPARAGSLAGLMLVRRLPDPSSLSGKRFLQSCLLIQFVIIFNTRKKAYDECLMKWHIKFTRWWSLLRNPR